MYVNIINNHEKIKSIPMFLAQCLPFWEDIGEQRRSMIVDSSIIRQYNSREIIDSSAETRQGFMLVWNGIIKNYIVSEEGEEIFLFTVAKNEPCVLAARGLMGDSAFLPTIQAMGKSEIICINSEVWGLLARQIPAVGNYMLKVLASHMDKILRAMDMQLFYSVERRLAHFVVNELRQQRIREHQKNTLNITHEELAGFLGTAREVVSRSIGRLKRRGILECCRGRITVLDYDALLEISKGKSA